MSWSDQHANWTDAAARDLEFLHRTKAQIFYDHKGNCVVSVRREGKLPVQPTRPTLKEAIAEARRQFAQHWWCNTHEREAVIDDKGAVACHWRLGGIMIPCRCVDLTGIAEVTL